MTHDITSIESQVERLKRSNEALKEALLKIDILEAININLMKENMVLLQDKYRLDAIEAACWDLKAEASPTAGGDDADIDWIIIEHHMSDPKERQLARTGTVRSAIDEAINPTPIPEEEFEEDTPEEDELKFDENYDGNLEVEPNNLR